MGFHYQEPDWYYFGLKLALLNLGKNGLALGPKKTLGKIFQPLNSYSRFPEYYFVGQAVRSYLQQRPDAPCLVLDVGSPKLFGLFLAYHYNLKIILTDLTRLNLDEYLFLWNNIKDKAKGSVHFEQLDGRTLSYANGQFDIVYAMSVVEHIGGQGQDSVAVAEMWRVLKPEGQLVMSVPVGSKYVEQSAAGFAYADEAPDTAHLYFFQRIYDQTTVQKQLLDPLSSPEGIQAKTIYRWDSFFTTAYHRIRQAAGENINGLLGFLNPWLSLLINRHQDGFYAAFFTEYAEIHSLKDIYGDLILSCSKPGLRDNSLQSDS